MDLQIPVSSAMEEEIVQHAEATIMTMMMDLETRRKLIRAIDEYEGEDPLHPWLDWEEKELRKLANFFQRTSWLVVTQFGFINSTIFLGDYGEDRKYVKWVQDAFPLCGDCSGVVDIYEQCVRSFWHEERYKDDLRYLKVWLEYAESCADAEVVYRFIDANKIGQTHSIFYISYALQLESNNKIVTANDIYDRGISRNAQPIEKLKSAYKNFLARSMNRPKAAKKPLETHQHARCFGTVLAKGGSGNRILGGSEIYRRRSQQEGPRGAPLKVFKDTSTGGSRSSMNPDLKPWHYLGTRAERNKENEAIPAKWTSNKRPGHRIGAATTPCIEVFVDEESSEPHNVGSEGGRSFRSAAQGQGRSRAQKGNGVTKGKSFTPFPASSFR